MLVRGFDVTRIKRLGAPKFNVSQAYMAKVIKVILKEWAMTAEDDMRVKRYRAIAARKNIISQAWINDDMTLALRAEDSLSEIEGTRYDEMLAEDNDLKFEISIKKPKNQKDADSVKEYDDELENPGAFERRQEKQVKEFMDRYG